jgi:molecular chaperone GrpE
MVFNIFKDKNSGMKKKEHKENIKDKASQLITENPEEVIGSSDSSTVTDEPTASVEVLVIPDEKELLKIKVEELESAQKELNDRYLRLSAEFDNYRKRTLRERMELTKTAAESVLIDVLPVIDDFERAMHSIAEGMDFEATKEGILLIYNKFNEFSKQNGITEINANGQPFDTDLHEALTKVPAPSEDMKGKIVQVIQKGYYLNDKVIRFAKVVVGE